MISDSKKLKIIWKRRRENDERHKAHSGTTHRHPLPHHEPPSKRANIYDDAFTLLHLQPTQSTLIYVFDDGDLFSRHFVMRQFEDDFY